MISIPGFGGEIREREPLYPYTTWKIGGPARYLVFPRDTVDLEAVVRYAQKHCIRRVVIGAGSNLLVPDAGIDGIVIKMTAGLKDAVCVRYFDDEEADVYAGAGVTSGELLALTTREGLSGIEFLAGIPGSFGGMLAMNAGAFGREIMDVVLTVNFFSFCCGLHTVDKEELPYGYRSAGLGEGDIIIGALLRLSRGTSEAVSRAISENIAIRKDKQPLDQPSCGSVFRNPPGDSAGRLIEEAGLKGMQVGGARISEKHANFIVNTGGATAKDVCALIDKIKETIRRKSNIELHEEVVML